MRTWDQIFAALERHTAPKGHWAIDWNDHRASYQHLADMWDADGMPWDFESPEEAARALAQDRCAVLHWYNETPVASYKIAAPDMAGLQRMASKLIDGVLAAAFKRAGVEQPEHPREG